MNIAVVIPWHGRVKLARKVFSYHASNPVFTEGGVNDPLGAKFNRGFAHVRNWPLDVYDGAMIVGSDDLIHPDYFAWIRENKPVYCELGACHWFNGETGEMRAAEGSRLGAGTYMSREYLERCSYAPYEPEKNKMLDSGPPRWLKRGERTTLDPPEHPIYLIDIKGPGSMWGWDWVTRLPRQRRVDADKVFASFGLEKEEWMGLV